MNKSILIIGTGSIGRRHVKNLLSLGENSVAFVEADNARRAEIEREFSIRGYSDPKIAMQERSPAVVLICTPADSHIALATDALQHGAHIFIEKPISTQLEGIDELAKLAKEKERIGMVACNFRFHPFFNRLKDEIASGELGEPNSVNVVYSYNLREARPHADYRTIYAAKPSLGGGVIFDSGAHVVDYLRALFGAVTNIESTYGNASDLEISTEDYAAISLIFESNVKSNIKLNYFDAPQHRIEVLFEKGSCTADLIANTFERKLNAKSEVSSLYSDKLSRDQITNQMYIDEIECALNAIRTSNVFPQTILDAKETVRVLLAIKSRKKT
jgi:predicted dehydrogenase